MRDKLRTNENKTKNTIPEKTLDKKRIYFEVKDKQYGLDNYNKASIKQDLKQKIKKINEEEEKHIFSYKNKICSKSAKKERENIKNENFLVNKIMKYKNMNEKKSPKETDFNRLQKKKVYISNFGTPKNREFFENFSNAENFCLKKKKN